MTLYHARPGELVAQPGRAVTNFPGGLVRVDQTYIGQTSMREDHRLILAVGSEMPDGNKNPSIEGIFIYPDVNEIEREDGFTEYRVSAYGRRSSRLSGLNLTQKEIVYQYPGDDITFSVYEATGTITVPIGTVVTVSLLDLTSEVLLPFNLNRGENWKVIAIRPGTNIQLPPRFFPQAFGNPDAIQIDASEIFSPDSSLRREYLVELENLLVSEPNTFLKIYVKDPVVKTGSQQSFGRYVEYQVEVTREEDLYENVKTF